jgi:hypothetical protein
MGTTGQETLLPLLGDSSYAYILQGRQYQTITSLSRTKEIEPYNMCIENNKKHGISMAIKKRNKATMRQSPMR